MMLQAFMYRNCHMVVVAVRGLNHSKTIRSVLSLPLWCLEHSRDITLLIVLCDLIPCSTPVCFSTFY